MNWVYHIDLQERQSQLSECRQQTFSRTTVTFRTGHIETCTFAQATPLRIYADDPHRLLAAFGVEAPLQCSISGLSVAHLAGADPRSKAQDSPSINNEAFTLNAVLAAVAKIRREGGDNRTRDSNTIMVEPKLFDGRVVVTVETKN